MSDATPMLDDEAMLNRLAACDLAAAERVHARLMAAEEASEIADLGRTYQRLARSLRQTLALKAKLEREREAAQSQAAQAQTERAPAPYPDSPQARLQRLAPEVRAQADRVHAAVMRYVEREDELPDYLRIFYEGDIDEILADLALEEGFSEAEVADLVARVCEIMDRPYDADGPPEPGPQPAAARTPADPPIHDSA